MSDLDDGDVVLVQGSAKEPYELKNTGGVFSCTCPAWRNAGGPIDARTCKHLRGLRGDDAEAERLGVDVSALGGKVKRISGTKRAASATGESTSEGDDEDSATEGPPLLLAHKWENDVALHGWWMSEKLDGVRAYWDGTKFQSRLGNTFLAPAWFTAGLPTHPLDGELWVGRGEFQTCVSIVRRQDAGPQWKQVQYLVFDAPHLDRPFEERLAYLATLWKDGHPYARPHAHERCDSVEQLRAELARVEALGGEGLMLRKPGSKYEVGRSTTLLKVKTFHDAEGRVVGYEAGRGKHKGRTGAIELEAADGTRFTVGTGLSDAERKDPPPIGAIVTYRYQELTRDGVPRFPSYVGVAIDKAAPTVAARPKTASATVSRKVNAAANTPTTAAAELGAQRFVATEDGAAKFWEIAVDGAAHTVRFGKLGTPGQTRTKTFASEAAARADAEKLIGEKTRKGYRAE